jgi:23S rRNA pseudouridine2605 synthase/16S rRNA pseudouridine516 synthase
MRHRSPHRPPAATPSEKPDWLSRALARAGVLPVEEAEDAVRAGRVTLNGRQVRQPLAPVPPGAVVKVDGHRVSVEPVTRVLAFHKPPGCVTSTKDREGKQPTVFELLVPTLPQELASFGWHAIGRLDRDTTGLLLFTNDERLVTHATAPETKLPRRYVAAVHGQATDARLEPLRQGVTLDDGPARPAKVRLREPGVVELTITEGRNHQVKRMLGAVGLPVKALHREAVGRVELGDVPQGGWRLVEDAEVREALGYTPRQG